MAHQDVFPCIRRILLLRQLRRHLLHQELHFGGPARSNNQEQQHGSESNHDHSHRNKILGLDRECQSNIKYKWYPPPAENVLLTMFFPPLLPILKPTERCIELNQQGLRCDPSIVKVTIQSRWDFLEFQNHRPLIRDTDQSGSGSVGISDQNVEVVNAERGVRLHMLSLDLEEVVSVYGVGDYQDLVLADVEAFPVVEVYILDFVYLVVEPIQVEGITLNNHLSHKHIFMIFTNNLQGVGNFFDPRTNSEIDFMNSVFGHIFQIQHIYFTLFQNIQMFIVSYSIGEAICVILQCFWQACEVLINIESSFDFIFADRVGGQAQESVTINGDHLEKRRISRYHPHESCDAKLEPRKSEIIALLVGQQQHFASIGQIDLGLNVGEGCLGGVERDLGIDLSVKLLFEVDVVAIPFSQVRIDCAFGQNIDCLCCVEKVSVYSLLKDGRLRCLLEGDVRALQPALLTNLYSDIVYFIEMLLPIVIAFEILDDVLGERVVPLVDL